MNTSRLIRSVKPRVLARFMGHDHHHTPNLPPFARLKPATQSLYLHNELVWDDTVAPETCVDFDAPQVNANDAIKGFLLGIGFFIGLFTLIKMSDPASRSPVTTRAAILNRNDFLADIGLGAAEATEDEE